MITPQQLDDARALATVLRHEARGRAAAIVFDDLAARLSIGRRRVERAIHSLRVRGIPVGTACANLAGEAGDGASARGMGAFWIITESDWQAAWDNIEKRFRPLAMTRRGLLRCRPRTGRGPIEEARRDLAALVERGSVPAVRERDGQGCLFHRQGMM